MILVLLVCIFITHPSIEECMDKKVSIAIDLEEEIVLNPLNYGYEKLLWHVAILKQEDSEVKFLCSGTIVGRHHVVTTAACVADVVSSDLRVVAGLTILRSPHHAVENPHSVFIVTKKYYRHLPGDLVEDNLAILKLKTKATFKVPQLIELGKQEKHSKHCFTLGWGLHNHSSSDTLTCPNPSFQDSINRVLSYSDQSRPFLNKILDIRNFMGFSSMFIFQLSRILDILPGFPFHNLGSKLSQDAVCPAGEFARLKTVRLSTKQPYDCLCRKANRLCVYSLGIDDISQQIDIGSPVFCKLKKPKVKSLSHLTEESRYIFTGVIMTKETEEVRWLKFGSSIDMITASNVSALTEFILAVIFDKSSS